MTAVDLRRDWRRRLRLDCGCTLPCRCDDKAQPSPGLVDAYAHAVAMLDDLGYPAAPLLPEIEVLLRHGAEERRMVAAVLRRWGK